MSASGAWDWDKDYSEKRLDRLVARGAAESEDGIAALRTGLNDGVGRAACGTSVCILSMEG